MTAAAVAAAVAFTACSKKNNEQEKDPTYDEGVVINGVKWATRNVDEAGTFVPTPESIGKYYQWNRKKAWAATGNVTGWDATMPTGDRWEEVNDPSPTGWRVPTREDFQTLLDAEVITIEWIIQQGVRGMKFTDKTNGNSIFFPVTCVRMNDNGSLAYCEEEVGAYWVNGTYLPNPSHAYCFVVMADSYPRGTFGGTSRDYGRPVRCVLVTPPTP